jgi:ubiquinone/menaquinone biosynthesis C-methylase UbiE
MIFEIVKWTAVTIGIFLFLILVVIRIIRHYYHFPIPSYLTQLIDNPIRRRLIQKPDTIADRMHLSSGLVVVEIGPGKGSYTIAVAKKILPEGKVFAVDIQKSVINRLKERVKTEKITNIYPKIDDAHDFSFGNESVDRIFAIASLPEIPEPIKVLCECYRVLKRNGILSLCELVIDPDYPRRKTEKRWAKEAGFKLETQYSNILSYQLNFKKIKKD